MIYTIKEYKKELDRRLKQVDEAKIIYTCASSAHAKMVERIFVLGLDKNLQAHGTYSRKALYVNTTFNSPVKLQSVGKTGESVFKSGKPHKTTYFKGGYRQFKMRIGKGGRVDFWLFGKFKNDYTNSLQRQGKTWVTGVKSGDNSAKLKALIEKFGTDSWMFDKKIREAYTLCVKKKLDKKLLNVPARN